MPVAVAWIRRMGKSKNRFSFRKNQKDKKALAAPKSSNPNKIRLKIRLELQAYMEEVLRK